MPTEVLPELPATPRQAARAAGHLLVIDDEEPNRLLLRAPLEVLGYEVSEAANALEALHLVARQPPDTILLDVMMPGMDGFQLCRRLKNDRQTAHIPVLMVTALTERKERLLGIQAGANDFLNKPVDMQDLVLRVGNALFAKSLFDQLQAERQKSERLLLNSLPPPIAERMLKGETSIADHHAEASVLVADLVGFTALAALVAPEQIVSLLNEIFSTFDVLTEQHGLEKIKTIGDAYMVAGGVPLPRPDHLQAMAQLALGLRTAIGQFNAQYDTSIHLRIGLHTGPVIAGVIGRKRFAYDLWGDTVNVACRLEALTPAGCIAVSDAAYDGLKDTFRFDGEHTVEIKGRGPLTIHHLVAPA